MNKLGNLCLFNYVEKPVHLTLNGATFMRKCIYELSSRVEYVSCSPVKTPLCQCQRRPSHLEGQPKLCPSR